MFEIPKSSRYRVFDIVRVNSISILQSKNHAMLDVSKEKLYGPFFWIGFNNHKAAEPLEGNSVLLAALWYSFDLSFENYLQNPKQHTKIGSASSSWYHII